MEVKLGCMIRPYMNYSVERALEGIARAGYRYTAFLGKLQDGGAYDLSTPISESLAVKKKMESFGLKAVTAWAGNPFGYGVEGLLKHVEIAQTLGLEYLIISSPYIGKTDGPRPTHEEVKAKFTSIIEPALPACEKAGVRLDIKPHMGPFGMGPGLMELATAINHPCFGISYDPGNVHFYEGLSPETDLVPVASQVTSLCVKDHKGEKAARSFPTPGEGDVQWQTIFNLLGKGDFNGYALIEVMEEENAEALDVAGARVRERLTHWIETAGGKVER